MPRFSLVLAAGGALLLLTWALAPAAPTPRADGVAVDSAQQTSSAVSDVNAQVDRLRSRLAAPPPLPPPDRDPFRFGRRPEPPAPKPAPRAEPIVPPAPPPPVLPRLLGIMVNTTGGTIVRTAALAFDVDVTIVRVGDKFGSFVVHNIDTDVLELIDPATKEIYRLSLRLGT